MKLTNNLLFLFILSCLALSCKNNATSTTTENTESTTTESGKENTGNQKGKEPSCYRYFGSNKDTVYLQLSEVYGQMTGMLLIKNYQKDQNLGTLMGSMVGDVLLADYTFKSEGVTSVRQVAFRKKGSDYIEGYGDVKEEKGKMIFSDLKNLAFDETRVYLNVPCKN